MNQIKGLRLHLGLKQVELAKILGVSQGTLSNWERGNYEPDIDSLVRISEYFSKSVNYIIGVPEDAASFNESPKSTYDDLKFALFGDAAEEITDEMFADVKRYAQFIAERKRAENDTK